MPIIDNSSESTGETAVAAKVLKPRRGLPSGRAVVGALLVTISAVGSFALASRNDGTPGTSYLMSTRAVEAGTAITLDDVAFMPMVLPHPAAANAITSAAGVVGAISVRDLSAGDVVTGRDLIPAAAPGGVPVGVVHELSLPVASDRIVGRTGAGDRVTVLVALQHDGEEASVVAAEDVLVLQWSPDGARSGSGVLTLALDDADAAMGLSHLVRQGDVTVVRTTRAADEVYPGYLSTADLLQSARSLPPDSSGGPGSSGPSAPGPGSAAPPTGDRAIDSALGTEQSHGLSEQQSGISMPVLGADGELAVGLSVGSRLSPSLNRHGEGAFR